MKLLTKELRRRLPALYSTRHTGLDDKIIHCSFFTPDSSWTWLAVEGSPVFENNLEMDFRFFGYVIGTDPEWGYFHLSELASARGPMGLPIERDCYFATGRFSEVIKRYRSAA